MDNIFSSNISQRSEEGNIGKNQWNIFKKFCLWAAAAAVIPFIIVAEYSLYNGISGNSIIFVFLLSILIFILCFIIPAKKAYVNMVYNKH